MALKDRVRRALGRPSDSTRTSSTSSSCSTSRSNLQSILTDTTSNPSATTLTKTPSRLSKITSWRSRDESQKWRAPQLKYPAPRDIKHQELLNGFEMKFGRTDALGRPSVEGRWSLFSGISPMASRNCSLDQGQLRGGTGLTLSRQASRRDLEVAEVVAED